MRWIVLWAAVLAACGGGDGDGGTDAGAGGRTDGGALLDGGGALLDGGGDVDSSVRTDGGGEPGWRADTPLDVPLQEITAAVVNGRIWVGGGIEDGATVPTMRVYDPEADTWDTGPDLPQPRHHMMLVALGGDLYAIGGMRDLSFEPLDTAWVLRAGADDWEAIASMPEPRAAGIGGAIDGRVFIAGGQARGGALASDTLVFDPAAGTWSPAAAIPSRREHLAGFVWDGELWAVGGRRNSLSTNTDVVEIYDPSANTWRDGPTLRMARGGFAAAVLDGVAYAVGGEQPDRALHEAEALTLPDGVWTDIPRVPTPRHGHAMAAAAGRVYVIGGADEPIFAAVDAVESYAP